MGIFDGGVACFVMCAIAFYLGFGCLDINFGLLDMGFGHLDIDFGHLDILFICLNGLKTVFYSKLCILDVFECYYS
jgi:hypothetical protein